MKLNHGLNNLLQLYKLKKGVDYSTPFFLPYSLYDSIKNFTNLNGSDNNTPNIFISCIKSIYRLYINFDVFSPKSSPIIPKKISFILIHNILQF